MAACYTSSLVTVGSITVWFMKMHMHIQGLPSLVSLLLVGDDLW